MNTNMNTNNTNTNTNTNTNMMMVETTPGSQLNDRKHSISNLEKQYSAPLGQRLVMGIQIDAKCLEGGVEAVSKRARQERNRSNPNANANANANQMSMSMSSTPNHNQMIDNNNSTRSPDANGMTSIDFNQNATDLNHNNSNESHEQQQFGDPFSFLNDGAPQQQQPQMSSQSNNNRKQPFGGRLGFLKKVAAKTTDTLERGMQGLALRMDQGKNADLVRIGIYDPLSGELLGVTESLPVPGTALEHNGSTATNTTTTNTTNANATANANANASINNNTSNSNPNKDHLRFEVPLWIPGSRRQQSLLLKVWIQSGANLVLRQSAKSAKNYLLGSAMVHCNALTEGVMAVPLSMTTSNHLTMSTNTTNTNTNTNLANNNTNLNLTGSSNSNGNGIQPQQQHPQQHPPSLQLCILPDPKFSPILTRGWSLTDPDMSGYSSTLHYLPLDQSYIFPGKQPHHWLIAHEKATESTMPLPIAASITELAADACDRSLAHAQSVARILRNNRHDHKDLLHKATCQLNVVGIVVGGSGTNHHHGSYSNSTGAAAANNNNTTKATISVAWRRPDSIFEFEIASNESVPVVPPNGPTPGGYAGLKRTFYPKLCSPANGDHILPGILQAYGGKMPHIGYFLGGVYFSVTIEGNSTSTTSTGGVGSSLNSSSSSSSDPFAPTSSSVGTDAIGGGSGIELWETVLGLEAFVKATTPGSANSPSNHRIQTIQVPLRKGSEDVGHLLLQLQVTLPEGAGATTTTNTNNSSSSSSSVNANNYMATLPATDGLVSLVGMDGLSDGVKPYLDSLPTTNDGSPSPQHHQHQHLRHQQLDTMGYFFTTQYMDQHLALRQSACDTFRDRARSYKYSLMQPETNAPAHTLRTPKNFRPSSSRMTALLSGLPFNCHICSLNINVMDAFRPRQRGGTSAAGAAPSPEYPGASFHNVTCGAPSDHARGFGNILTNVSTKQASGGLRRLEAKRKEYSQQLQQAQSNLIAGIGHYLTEARKNSVAGAAVHHVPARHAQIQQLRWRVFECVHILHHITWMCAVRRANVFSQSLGLAVSSFLASLSDVQKCAAGWPAVWARHGFLVCFEGLLSAAGKELGMIEDASVAIAMLRMVSIVLVPATEGATMPPKAVQVPASPYLKWTKITAGGGDGSARTFVLQIGIDSAYYAERIPPPLQNNAPVRLYPILFEVGVDIKQWGANTGSNLRKNNNNGNNNNSNSMNAEASQRQPSVGSIVDDGDDDDVGIVDDDVLVALNYEAMRKMNCYAHALSPQQIPPEEVAKATETVFASSLNNTSLSSSSSSDQQQQLPIHPSLATLNSHILSSAGKMNHSILDEAATIAQQLGGGGLVFCKSGKDRTAMHLTYKQCQFAGRYRGNHDQTAILRDAALLRLHGTRLPICEKNVGQALYAFNSLQAKFMPEALKPPMDCLAGFLKGGEIFKGGGLES